MDIKSKAVSTTGVLHLRDASDELLYSDGQPVIVNVYSPGSAQHAKATARQQNRMLDMMKRKGKADVTAEQKAVENAEFLADCTVSFENLDYDDLIGRELAIAVYSDKTIGFIADQVATYIGDWSNFTQPSAKS
jgi:hypothetical protein